VGRTNKETQKKVGLTQEEFAGRGANTVDCAYIGKMEREEQYPSLSCNLR